MLKVYAERFKAGKAAFAANASAVLVKAGAAASAGYERGAAVFVSPDGGMMLEAAIGAQKFIYRPAALGRTRHAPQPGKTAATKKSSKPRASAARRKTPKRRGKAARR